MTLISVTQALTYWAYADYSSEIIANGLGIVALVGLIPFMFLPETAGTSFDSLDRLDADFSVTCDSKRVDCCGED